MRPNPLASRRRTPATEYSLSETVLVMAALSVLPLTLLVAAAAPMLAFGAAASVAAVAVATSVVRRLRDASRDRTRVCVPGTEVCARV